MRTPVLPLFSGKRRIDGADFHLRLKTESMGDRKLVLQRCQQIFCWLLGAGCIAWAHLDSRFRDAEGYPSGAYCLPIALGIALFFFGYSASRSWTRFAAWLALAIVGQAVSLQMIEAGQAIRYQHYSPLPRLLESNVFGPWLLVFLAGQAALVFAGLLYRLSSIRLWLGRYFRVWQIAGFGLAFFLMSATVSRDVSLYLMELPFAAFVQGVNFLTVLLAALALPEDVLAWWKERLEKLLGRGNVADDEKPNRSLDAIALVAATWVTLLSSALSFFSYERHPHIPDEVVYLLHARYLAEGMLAMPAPPVPEAFNIDLMSYETDRWFCPVPPGWPAALALGVLLGGEWLVNPVLAGLNVLLAYVLIRELYDRHVARLMAILLCFSPWYVLMGMNFMPHTFTLTCALVAAVAVLRARRETKWVYGWALMSGVATGMVGLIRPLEGLVVAGLIGLWIIGVGGRRLKITGMAAFALGLVAVGAVIMPYNKLLTGSPTKFPIMDYADKNYGPKTNALGFGPERGLGWALDPYPGHGWPDVLVNSNLNITSINFELFGWSGGSLLFIALLMLSGVARDRDYLMIATIAAIFVAHIFYWFSGGPDFGARYWYLMIIPCAALTVRGIQFLEMKLNRDVGQTKVLLQEGKDEVHTAYSNPGARLIVLVLSLCALALVNYFPWRAIDKYHHYLRMRPDIRSLARQYDFGKSLVLIRGERFPDFMSAAVYNPLDLRAAVPIYAWDRDHEVRSRTLSEYADRTVWILEGPSITGAGFKVIEGPLPARDLLAREASGFVPVKSRR